MPSVKKALADLLDFVVSGRRYETRNPHTIPEVRAAQAALAPPSAKRGAVLNKKNRARVARAAEAVKEGDLYDALHRVGDDPCKSEIEDALRELLDEDTFRDVVAVFKVATSDEV